MRTRMKTWGGICGAVLLFLALFAALGGMTAQAEQTGGDWEYRVNEETRTVTVTAYHGSEQSVTIPEMLGGYPVTAIGEGAFQGNAFLEAVIMPDTISVIGKQAFAECGALTDVTLSQGLARIETSAFEASKVKAVTIPDSVSYIGPYAFRNCTGLRTLELGSGISEWGQDWGTNGAFAGCTLLDSLTVKAGASSIGESAFAGCTLLMEIILPESVTLVEGNAFRDCELLDTAVVYGDVGEAAFQNCTSLKNLTLMNAVQIGGSAFENNTALEQVALPDTLTSIGQSAFSGCTKLKEAVIPDRVSFVGAYAFQNCTQMERAVLGSGISEWGQDWGDNSAFAGCTKLNDLTIREGAASLPFGAFSGCSALEQVEIPGSVVSIAEEAFSDCQRLETVTLSEGIQSIGNAAFKNCTQLHTADLPATLTSLGNEAFRYTQLRHVNIPDKVSSIGCYAFADCPALKNVSLGAGVEEWVEDWGTNGAFMNDTRLESLTIEDGVLSIGSSAFENCTSLRHADMPITVTIVGERAFAGCTSLIQVSMQRGEIEGEAFADCTALYQLYLERITRIGSGAFRNNTALYEVILPDTLTSIENSAFQGCSSISEMILPDSLTYLGAYAFADCTGLLWVQIGNNITEWGSDWGTNGAFMNDTALLYATVDEGANSLGGKLFAGCTSLAGVSLPESIVSWSEDLFTDCPETLTLHVSGPQMQALSEALGRKTSQEALVIPVLTNYTITVTAGENGSAGPGGKIVKPQGSSQQFAVLPDRGYLVESFTVDGMVWDYTTPITGIQKDMAVNVTFAPDPAYVEEYPDLEEEEGQSGMDPSAYVRFTEEDPAYAMANMYFTGVLSGASDRYLGETDTVTEGAAVSLLYRLEGMPQMEWTDYGPNVPQASWYGPAVVWAASVGLLNEADARNFSPDEPMGAGPLAVLIYRYACWKDIPVGPTEDLSLTPEEETAFALAWAGENGWNAAAGETAPVQCGSLTRLLASFLADQIG